MWVRGSGRFWILAVLALVSCKRHAEADLHAARAVPSKVSRSYGKTLTDRELQGGVFRFRFALYLPHAPKLDLNRELTAAVAGSGLSALTQRPELEPPPKTTSVTLSEPDIDDFAPPRPESMKFRAAKLSTDEQQLLSQSRFVAVFDVIGPAARATTDYRRALLLGQSMATKLGGILWDDETRHAFTLKEWTSRIDSWQGELPQASAHVTIDLYRDGELMRLVSLGMLKFGLPDVVINQASDSESMKMGNVMNLVMQRMLERRAADEPGLLHLSLDEIANVEAKRALDTNVLPNAKRKLDVTLVEVKPEQGDADNRLLELRFPGEGSLQERHASAVATLWGSSDSITHVEHDTALLEASARARKTALGFQARYAKGPPFGERLLVKAPFDTPAGGTEWMWVEVATWKGKRITGILDNDPFEIPTLKVGARVEVPADKIFDYLLIKPDGTQEGNETSKMIEAREKAQ